MLRLKLKKNTFDPKHPIYNSLMLKLFIILIYFGKYLHTEIAYHIIL